MPLTGRQPGSPRNPSWIVLILILYAAFALRIAGITQQSIWYDEGLSIHYARGGVRDVIQGISQSEHPPLHSLLLALWMRLAGDSELSVRMLSAWWGVLAVALIYRLSKRLSPAGNTFATLLLAFSPLAIWFSQETRGYTMALALAAAAVNAAWRLVLPIHEPRDKRSHAQWTPYLTYIALGAAALYTHLYSAFVLLALNVTWGIQQIRARRARRDWNRLLWWAGAQLTILALFALWLPYVAAQWRLNATFYHGAVDWKQIVGQTLIAFGVGNTLEGPWALAATWTLTALCGLGTAALVRRRKDRGALLLLWLWMLVPLVVQIALNRNLPKFAPRYLLNALPAFLLLAAAGIRWLVEQLALAGAQTGRMPNIRGGLAAIALLSATAMIGGATTRSLANHYLDEDLYRPDVRGVARYIEEHATDQDVIVLLGGHNYPAFAYYYRGSIPMLPLPDALLPDTRAPVDVKALETLDQGIFGHQRLWLVLWQEQLADPTGLIVDELEHTYQRLGVGQTFHDIGLLLFDVSPGPLLAHGAAPTSPLQASFADAIGLQGYDLPESTTKPGGTLYLYLYWESLGHIDHDYKVFTQILDERGIIVAQHDKIAGAESYPTSHWPPGALVRDRFMLTVRPDAAPGPYTLIAGLYRPGGSMPRLPATGEGAYGDHVVLAPIQIRGD